MPWSLLHYLSEVWIFEDKSSASVNVHDSSELRQNWLVMFSPWVELCIVAERIELFTTIERSISTVGLQFCSLPCITPVLSALCWTTSVGLFWKKYIQLQNVTLAWAGSFPTTTVWNSSFNWRRKKSEKKENCCSQSKTNPVLSQRGGTNTEVNMLENNSLNGIF